MFVFLGSDLVRKSKGYRAERYLYIYAWANRNVQLHIERERNTEERGDVMDMRQLQKSLTLLVQWFQTVSVQSVLFVSY